MKAQESQLNEAHTQLLTQGHRKKAKKIYIHVYLPQKARHSGFMWLMNLVKGK